MNDGSVASIHIAETASAPMQSIAEANAVSGKGLEGDRYFGQDGTLSRKTGPDREITLIEMEAVEALQREYNVAITPGEARRNVVTKGVALNHLVRKDFKMGGATMRGIRLCEPCGHLEKVSKAPGAKQGLIHRGGLRAQILESGTIRVGDEIKVI